MFRGNKPSSYLHEGYSIEPVKYFVLNDQRLYDHLERDRITIEVHRFYYVCENYKSLWCQLADCHSLGLVGQTRLLTPSCYVELVTKIIIILKAVCDESECPTKLTFPLVVVGREEGSSTSKISTASTEFALLLLLPTVVIIIIIIFFLFIIITRSSLTNVVSSLFN